jgi:hypothetical protein
MKRVFVFLALCASVSMPLAALAQPAPPTADQRATFDKMRVEAKTAAYAALTPAHAASVTTIAGQVAGGTLDRRTAAGQIDALLTPDETKAVLAAADKSRAAMRAAGIGSPGRPPGAGGPPSSGAAQPPGGPPPQGAPGGRFGRFTAGRYLLLVSMTPAQMRSLQPRARSSSAP